MCTVKADLPKSSQHPPNRLILLVGADSAARAATANSFAERTLIPKRLTPREEQVLKFIVEGLTNKQIAREIHVSVKTVEKHRQEIMNKLRIHHTAGLTCYALANGICFPRTVSASMARRVPSSRGNCSTPVEEASHNRAITRRETEVLRLIAEGMLNKQIAAELNLSVKTVINHRQEVMKRLNIHHIAGLTRYAVSNGLLNQRQ
ncbi:MAG TPA: LuxR C-terminal-related transcriptional regulator [Candidatus Limnocylindrales bacterium]|jgi:DNA-binding NarL/FixJ family response regulator|nr:LuxR C-terminal-related transcriptional regulator [Candidatus Limnocylindrales bacterium]